MARRFEPYLTERECEILTGLADGLSRKQIADRLCLSELTVKTHLWRITTRLPTQRAGGLVGWAFRNNYIQ